MPKKKVKYQKKVPFVGLQKPLVKLLGTEKQKKYLKQYCIDNNISTDGLDDQALTTYELKR